ncbi:MAG: hypothetical protein AAGA65_26460 [Actinomycetota bacterium]
MEIAERQMSPAEVAGLCVGILGVVFPLVFVIFLFEPRGELGLLVVVFAAYLVLFQSVVWAGLWWVARKGRRLVQAVAFGVGSWLALLTSWMVLATQDNVGWATGSYVLVATLTVATSHLVIARGGT